jgi:hypothetical protein
MRRMNYPAGHKVGMRVPEGGSDCEKCEYVRGNDCSQPNFVKWNKGKKIPGEISAYCCDFFEAKKVKRGEF